MKIQILVLRQLVCFFLFSHFIITAKAQGVVKPILAYLLSDLPTLKAPYPSHFMLVDVGREGLFRLDNDDNDTPDNRGTVLIVGGNKRYKRAYKGMIEVEWFGAKGNSEVSAAANTAAIQAACDWAALNSGTRTDPTHMPINKDRPAVVHIPAGTYFTSRAISLRGAINIKGDGGMSFGGTVIFNSTSGEHVFSLAGAPETGISNAVEIHDIRILMAGSQTESSAIYSGATPQSSYNSLRVEGVWFQLNGASQHAYEGLKADDVKFTNCTFDGTVAVALVLGSNKNAGNYITNFSVQNCTFYMNQGGVISARNVDGLLFSGNRVYSTVGNKGAANETPFVIDAVTNSIKAEGVQIIGNNFDKANRILMTQHDGSLVVGNIARNCTSRMIEFRTKRTIRNGRFSDNIFYGKWSGTDLLNGSKVPNAAIAAYDATVANSEFQNTIIDESGSSSRAYYIPKTGTPYNIINSKVTGFSTPYEIGDPANNLYSETSSSATTVTKQSSKPKARAGVVTATTAQSQEAILAASNAKLTSAFSVSFTTKDWSTSKYVQVVEPASLAFATVYLVKAVYNKAGLDVITQSWIVPITTTYPNSSTPPDLIGNVSVYSGNAERYIKLRQKHGPVPNTTFGLEAALSKADMMSTEAKLELIITPLL